jgi:hypothetical protein
MEFDKLERTQPDVSIDVYAFICTNFFSYLDDIGQILVGSTAQQ